VVICDGSLGNGKTACAQDASVYPQMVFFLRLVPLVVMLLASLDGSVKSP
jgi:uncharacterized membrane protein YtjA (UPF0391 family)